MIPIPLALYIHFPWCIQKCPYCDFNSHAVKPQQTIPEERYINTLLKDLEAELPTIWGRRISSIFLGGGTPSLFSAKNLEKLITSLRQYLFLHPQLEITLEANPGTFEQERFSHYREIGINRLSIGIQSFNTQHLKTLGRIHNAQEAIQATKIAQQAGFENINLDIMFGLPKQNLQQAMNDLQIAIDSKPQHLSFYQLTIEPNTYFHHQLPPKLPNDDLLSEMQIAGIELLQKNDYRQYEVSAYAKKNQSSKHNLNYWQFGDYIGIGAGAHGKITDQNTQSITRYHKKRHPHDYMQTVQRQNEKTLIKDEICFEFMLNALRLKNGFELTLFEERTGLAASLLENKLDKAIQKGLLVRKNNKIQTTTMGWQFLNDTMMCFL